MMAGCRGARAGSDFFRGARARLARRQGAPRARAWDPAWSRAGAAVELALREAAPRGPAGQTGAPDVALRECERILDPLMVWVA